MHVSNITWTGEILCLLQWVKRLPASLLCLKNTHIISRMTGTPPTGSWRNETLISHIKHQKIHISPDCMPSLLLHLLQSLCVPLFRPHSYCHLILWKINEMPQWLLLGRKFDKNGELIEKRTHWSGPSIKTFQERAKCLVEQFSKYKVLNKFYVSFKRKKLNIKGKKLIKWGKQQVCMCIMHTFLCIYLYRHCT